ncbi:MAG: ATP-binding protein [Lachnospiraceae bacterium]|nr:ATP-binding protein [Lachnospiraceae bacterium]
MLKRKFYDYLTEWKRTKKRECLLVNGARQVGKTFIIEKFGKENYKQYIYINFVKNPEYRTIFEGSLEPEELYRKMSLTLPRFRLEKKNTLIFLDEIQVCLKARTALKFLALEDDYDVIVSGSLLGIHYRDEEAPQDEISIPVGYERKVLMHALDFEEYLWAMGVSEEAISILRDHFDKRTKMDPSLNDRYMRLLREYLFVGGMPDVVNVFLSTNNFQEVHQAQEKVLRAYEDDIDKYAKNAEKPKIRSIYRSIPRQLAKEYTKFQYKTVEKNGSARKYDNAIDWLVDAGLICGLYNVSLPMMPLRAYEKPTEFKMYVSDIGLLTAMYGFESQRALLENTLVGPAKGGIYENLIFTFLYKKEKTMFYYRKENSTQELEFLFEQNGGAVPVEVKSSHGRTISLNEYIREYNPPLAYKLVDGNIGEDGQRITLPLYMAMFL